MCVHNETIVFKSFRAVDDEVYRVIPYLDLLVAHIRVGLDQEGREVGQSQGLHLRDQVNPGQEVAELGDEGECGSKEESWGRLTAEQDKLLMDRAKQHDQ